MMLAQLTTVKSRLALDSFDVKDDTLITNFIKLVSDRFQLDCNRLFARAADTTYEFAADAWVIQPHHYPIESVSAWELKTSEADGFEALDAPSYFIGARRNIVELEDALGTSRQVARITYTGGYVLPGSTATGLQTALPDALEQACVEQVAYLYQQKDRLGLVSVSGEGGAIQQFAQIDLLPSVRAVLRKYERWLN